MASKVVRPIRFLGNIALVELSRGYVAAVDADDLHLVAGVNWSALVCGKTVYGMRRGPRPERKCILLHRAIMGFPEGLEIDHIDGDGLNNRRSNLRIATAFQNHQNTPLRVDSASGLKGAHPCRQTGRWKSEITANGRTHYLGRFDTPEAAHAAYTEASVRLHGAFGRVA